MKKGMVFGAGSIGRGLVGQIFAQSGMEVTFVDVDDALVDLLRERQSYPLTSISNEGEETVEIAGVNAIHGGDLERITERLRDVDVIATAVGAGNLPQIAYTIACGLSRRFATGNDVPVDILLCENLMHAPEVFRRYMDRQGLLSESQFLKIGLVDTSIGRMVPLATEEMRKEDPLRVYAEPYCKLQIDSEGVRGNAAQLSNVEAFSPFRYQKERKLYIHNLGHSVASYWGAFYRLEYIWQCMEHTEIKKRTMDAMLCSARAIAQKYEVDREEVVSYADDLLARFYNKPLMDTVLRGCRDPLRKLAPEDRFIGAIKNCQSQNVGCESILEATAAVLCYGNDSDAGAQELCEAIRSQGVSGFLGTYCELDAETAKKCSALYQKLRSSSSIV